MTSCMDLTRREVIRTGGGVLALTAAGCLNSDGESPDDGDDEEPPETVDDEEETQPDTEPEPEEVTLELLAEEDIDHDHACLHAEFDERTPLEAGTSADDAPTADETHVIWEVTYEGEGYVRFDADAHSYDGPFVFYTADGTVGVVEGTETERDEVPDDDCEPLDEYFVVEVPEDGVILLELSPQ